MKPTPKIRIVNQVAPTSESVNSILALLRMADELLLLKPPSNPRPERRDITAQEYRARDIY